MFKQLSLGKPQLKTTIEVSKSRVYESNFQLQSNVIIIRCNFFFLFIGWEPTTWSAKNCLQIMVCSCALAFDSDFATNNILLMRGCVHFREKWQLVFQEMKKSSWICLLGPKKQRNYKEGNGTSSYCISAISEIKRIGWRPARIIESEVTLSSVFSTQFPKVLCAKQIQWSNDKTVIELGSPKISWFFGVSQITIFCSTSSNNC